MARLPSLERQYHGISGPFLFFQPISFNIPSQFLSILYLSRSVSLCYVRGLVCFSYASLILRRHAFPARRIRMSLPDLTLLDRQRNLTDRYLLLSSSSAFDIKPKRTFCQRKGHI